MLFNLLDNWALKMAICIPSVVIAVLCAIFIIIVIMLQPSNSEGISALNGQQETFFADKKNKSKTLESKLRKLTVVTIAVMAVCMIAFCVAQFYL